MCMVRRYCNCLQLLYIGRFQKLVAAEITIVRNRKRTNRTQPLAKSGLDVTLIPILTHFISIGIQSK
jgi:hypothetical protein